MTSEILNLLLDYIDKKVDYAFAVWAESPDSYRSVPSFERDEWRKALAELQGSVEYGIEKWQKICSVTDKR